jgi:hypothetical protein
MKAWVDDHVHIGECQRRRCAGEEGNLTQRLPSYLVMAAGQADPEIVGAALR